jgi:hypothetical protein
VVTERFICERYGLACAIEGPHGPEAHGGLDPAAIREATLEEVAKELEHHARIIPTQGDERTYQMADDLRDWVKLVRWMKTNKPLHLTEAKP